VLSRRTGWTLEWDVRHSRITVQDGEGGPKWSQKVGELPPNVQEIISRGGLENWVKGEISKDLIKSGGSVQVWSNTVQCVPTAGFFMAFVNVNTQEESLDTIAFDYYPQHSIHFT
jgi:hypothetical protein